VYFERASTSSFVKVECVGPELIRRWGQIEKPGQESTTTHASEADARAALQQQVFVLERKGYLAGRQNPVLLSMMERAPHDPGPFLVYADWLLERQDPRGELIARMSRGQEVESLLAAHPQLRPPWWERRVTLQWHLGFVSSLTFAPPAESPNAHWELRHILRHPSLWFARELVLQDVQAPYPHVLATWRWLLETRRPTLERVLLRGSSQLRPLLGQVRGLTA
jgi:uncharacterized protein (TIGR02996 family)